ncbi:MAG: UDP-glucose 4-epimerase GalE [Patescibacteria group bacterium]|nr:UDP-glucose 4-epimerase GalE [Patescibacteria group bacterium]
MNEPVIVTGGAGYIGSHTCIALAEAGFNPIIIENFCNSKKSIIQRLEKITAKKIFYIEADVCNTTLVEKKLQDFTTDKIHAIIHFAAHKSVVESISNPLEYYENNILSLISMLKIVRKYAINNFVFSSSCTVYGIAAQQPVVENMPIGGAINPYGQSKIMCEKIIEDSARLLRNTNFTILRYFNPIGNHPSGLIGDNPNGTPNNLLPYLLRVASGELEQLVIHGNDYQTPDKTCLRDFIHVMDLAEAHVAALETFSSDSNNLAIYNVGTGTPCSVLTLVKTFEKVTGVNINYTYGPRRHGDIEKIWADCSKINKQLRWFAKRSLEMALKDAWCFELNRKTQSNIK